MTSSEIDICTTLIGYITEELLDNRPGLAIGAGDDLLGSELVDSLGVMRLIQFMEQEYAVKVPPADVTIENFMTVQTISSYLEKRKKQDGHAADG